MNTVIAHLQMTVMMAHGFALSPTNPHNTTDTHTHGGRSGGGLFDQFVNGGVRGAGWAMGSRLMHALPIGLLIVLAVVVGIVYFARRRRGN